MNKDERIKELEAVLEKITTSWGIKEVKYDKEDNRGIIVFYIHGAVMDEAIKVLGK